MLRAENETPTYKVVVNYEEQYSIDAAERRVPIGWRAVGKVAEEEGARSPGRWRLLW